MPVKKEEKLCKF